MSGGHDHDGGGGNCGPCHGCNDCKPRRRRGATGPTGPCCTGPTGSASTVAGPTGPCCTGPTGPGPGIATAFLTFSGSLQPAADVLPLASYLANPGVGLGGLGVGTSAIAPMYPLAQPTTFTSLAVNLSSLADPIVLPDGETIRVELIRRAGGDPPEIETGLFVEFAVGDDPIQIATGSVPFAAGDTFDLLVTTSGIASLVAVDLSATLGYAT